MSDPRDIVFTIVLTADEGKLVLEALAELPFKLVYELIGRLNRQANEGFGGTETHGFIFTATELAVTLKALGEQPFSRVHALMDGINAQARRQRPDGSAAHPRTALDG